MTAAKHSPAPWTATNRPYIDGTPYFTIKAGKGFYSNPEGYKGDQPGFAVSMIISPADAALIIAAPKMLVALQDIARQADRSAVALAADVPPGHCDYQSKTDGAKVCGYIDKTARTAIAAATEAIA